MVSKYFRDPIHGYIEVNPCALSIIDSPFFQRLRRIKQLGFSYFTYHGAEHTRFGHSLGVYHLARRISSTLLSDESREIREEFCIAALLHDVGHHPYSHAFESVLKTAYRGSGVDYGHETYTLKIIENTIIKECIEDNGLNFNHICQLIEGSFTDIPTLSFLNDLISSELDLDRIDYLLRDSYYCGVPYGQIDLERLMLSLKLTEGEIIITNKGKQSIEMYLLSRFYMYTQVYLHHTTRAFDLLLKNIFTADMIKAMDYPNPNKNINDIIFFDDIWLYNKILETAEKSDIYGYLAKHIINRDPIRCVLEKITFQDAQSQAADPEYSKIQSMFDYKDVIAKESGINENLIFIDEPWTDLPLENRYHPYTSKPAEEGNKTIKIETRLEPRDIAFDPSSISYYIAKYMAQIIRVYTCKEHRENLCKTISKRHSDLEYLLWY